MKKKLAIAAILPLGLMAATSTPTGFTDNLDEALAAAKANGKYLYVCFSGSDWCGWCRRLEKEVFSKPEFLDGVTNDFELVFIDSPEDKSLLSDHAKAENEKLVMKYKVKGFPTALILDGDGTVMTKTGYLKGGALKYVVYLQEIRANGPKLKEIEELTEKHIKPFEDKVRKIIFEDTLGRVSRMVEKLPEDQQEAKAKELAMEIFPASLKRIEDELETFKAKKVPELIAKQRDKTIADTEKMLKDVREYIEKQSK